MAIFAVITFCIMYFVSKRWRKDYRKNHEFLCTQCHEHIPSIRDPNTCDSCDELELLKEYNVQKIFRAKRIKVDEDKR